MDITTIALFPPPTPFEQNPAWQAVNKALNADIQFNILPSGDYAVRMATLMAGNDVPDMMFFWQPAGRDQRHWCLEWRTAVCRERLRGPHPVPRRRCGQGLPVSRGDTHERVGQFRIRLQRQATDGAAASSSAGLAVLQERQYLRRRDRQGLRPHRRSRPEAHHAGTDETSRGPLRHRPDERRALLRGVVRRPEWLASRERVASSCTRGKRRSTKMGWRF